MYTSELYQIVMGSATSEETLTAAGSTMKLPFAAVFIFVSGFEDSISACELSVRLYPDAMMYVRIFDEVVEDVYEQLSLGPEKSHYIQTFNSSLQAFNKLRDQLEGNNSDSVDLSESDFPEIQNFVA